MFIQTMARVRPQPLRRQKRNSAFLKFTPKGALEELANNRAL